MSRFPEHEQAELNILTMRQEKAMTDPNTEQENQPQDHTPDEMADESLLAEDEEATLNLADADESDGDQAQDDPQKQIIQLQDRLLRVTADYQNYVRRSQQNITTSLEQQLIGIARELVTVLDHFDRAVEVDPQATSTEDLLAGVTIVRDELMRALGRYDIERIDVKKGDPFDPNRHEAMMRQPLEDVESGHIASQFQAGYALKDKTIRPAGVSVAE
jgi:molecular chaperone GrpE